MKTVKYTSLLFLMIISFSCAENTKIDENKVMTKTSNGITTSIFKVWGNCEMCKETIENSLKIEGVSFADWNSDSKMITVIFNSKQINLDQIQKQIASVGYDNIKYTADDKVYENLHDCCQYDRK